MPPNSQTHVSKMTKNMFIVTEIGIFHTDWIIYYIT